MDGLARPDPAARARRHADPYPSSSDDLWATDYQPGRDHGLTQFWADRLAHPLVARSAVSPPARHPKYSKIQNFTQAFTCVMIGSSTFRREGVVDEL